MDLKSCYLGAVVFLLELQELVLWKECLWRQKANKTWNGQTGWLHLKTGIIDQFDQKALQTTGPSRFEFSYDGWYLIDINILLDYLIKTKVDFMLGSYMEDIGITAKEFEAACTQGKSITGKFHQQLFEQVPIYRIAD